MKRTFLIMSVGSLFLLTCRAGQDKDIHILQSDASGIVVEYIPAFRPAEKIIVNGQTLLRYSFSGAVTEAKRPSGSPEFLERSVLLRFPGTRGNTVELLRADYDDSANVRLAPVPFYRKDETGPMAVYSVNAAAYAASGMLPEKIVSLSGVAESRGVFLGDVMIHPYQYNAVLRVVRKYKRIVFRVGFGPAEPVRSNSLPMHIAVNDQFSGSPGKVSSIARNATVHNSVLSSGAWFRIPISSDGIYKITGQMLLNAGVPPSADPKTIKIYGNGGLETPVSVTDPFVDDLIQNAIYIFDGGTSGQLDASDYIVFYGKATRGWSYDPVHKSYSHYINHYTETDIYWLTYGGLPGKSMTSVASLQQPAPFRPNTAISKVFREDDRENLLGSGLEWLGQAFNPGDQITYVSPLPGLDASQPIHYNFNIGAQAPQDQYYSVYSTFSVMEHSTVLFNVNIPGTYTDGENYYTSSQFVNQVLQPTVVPKQLPSFSDAQSQLRFSFSSTSALGIGYIDWYELTYKRFLFAQGDAVSFSSYDTSAVTEYDVRGFSGGQVFVFDVSRFDSVVMITNPQLVADTCSFQAQLTAGSPREMFLVGPGGFKTPASITPVANQNLHGNDAEAPYIIITHSDFMSAAQRLQTYRQQSGPRPLKTLIVDINQIYNEFGGGLLSPAAIRNYLRYIYTNWAQAPQYVLLFGDGDFDYRRIIATGTEWVPPWETDESFIPISTYASDDEFVVFNTADRVNISIGRLTPRTIQQADILVDKIIEYETHPVTDSWKALFTFVADDGPQAPGINDGFLHTEQADAVAGLVPELFNKNKIYEYAYPTIESPGGRRKPAVNEAIDNQINQGTLVLNFTGHGNPSLWANEHVFTVESDFPLLHNAGKYFFNVAATCNFSYFDEINNQSGGEILENMQNAGAIAVFSATRPVYSFGNFTLNETLYENLFQTDSIGRILPQRIGDVVYRTKQLIPSNDIDNDLKYFLLGDPALTLAYPQFYATIDSINHVPNRQVVQLKALEQTAISATVRDTVTGLQNKFNGQAEVVVYDANHGVTLTDPDLQQSFTYVASGSALFHGQSSIINGAMNPSFIVPKDISYSGDNGRIAIYFSNSTSDGAGYTTNIVINGTDTAAVQDVTGPQIHLYIGNRGFRAGDIVSASPLLIVDLSDSSGINTSTSGIGHGIEIWLDNQTESTDLSSYYKSKTDTYRQGTVQYSLGALSEGSHKLRLRAWDTYDNSSTGETVFDVVTGVGLKMTNVYNYPNPMSSTTVFAFEHNQISALDAEVRIYTVAGRLIQSIKKTNIGTQFVQIPWDGRDKEGDIPANGVYLYKVTARTQDGRFSDDVYGKLSIIK